MKNHPLEFVLFYPLDKPPPCVISTVCEAVGFFIGGQVRFTSHLRVAVTKANFGAARVPGLWSTQLDHNSNHTRVPGAYKNQVKLDFIQPGKPTQNGHIESFNSKMRDECLEMEWFTSLSEARQVIEAWRIDYNTQRPHSSLNHLPPDLWAQKQNEKLLHQVG